MRLVIIGIVLEIKIQLNFKRYSQGYDDTSNEIMYLNLFEINASPIVHQQTNHHHHHQHLSP